MLPGSLIAGGFLPMCVNLALALGISLILRYSSPPSM